ncbi:MAG: hypothetical protein HIU82_01975 [Proteobacteria bacterium]|nr:hypothetical protein [Pseudomonadota bacterium]
MADQETVSAIELLRGELQQGKRTRSPLAQWMFRHHAEFTTLLLEAGVDWARLAIGFARLGLTDADGKPPRAGTVKITWRRVQSALEREGVIARRRRRRASGAAATAASALAPAPIREPPEAEPPAGPPQGAAPASRFKPVRRRAPEPARPVSPQEAAEMADLRVRVFGTKEG